MANIKKRKITLMWLTLIFEISYIIKTTINEGKSVSLTLPI